MGHLKEVAGEGSHIDMGILMNANVEDCLNHRKRHHQIQILKRIEMEIEKFKANRNEEADIPLWKNEKGKYKKKFSTKVLGSVLEKDISLAIGIKRFGSNTQHQSSSSLLG